MQETQHGAQAKVDKHAKTPHPTSATLGAAGGSMPAGSTSGQVPVWNGSVWAPGATTGASISTAAALPTTAGAGTAGSTGNAADAGHTHQIGAHAAALHAPSGTDPLFTGPGLAVPGYIEPFPAPLFTANGTISTGFAYLSMFNAPAAFTLTKLLHDTRGGVAAAGLTVARMGIYSLTGTTYTLLARTASDTTLGAATNTEYSRALSTTGTRQDSSAFPASLTLTPGQIYALAVIYVGTTMPNLSQGGTGMSTTMGARAGSRYVSGQSDLPLTFDNATVSGAANMFYMAAAA